jgi:DNA-binding NarL/FixJ family response regulator
MRVLIADDHSLVRLALRAVLEVAGTEVIGEAADGAEAVEAVMELKPDVLVLDMRMPEMGGVEVCKRLRELGSDVRIVVLSSFADDEDVFGALGAGASSYLMKDVAPDALVSAVRGVAEGQTVLDGDVANRLLGGQRPVAEPCADTLSPREREVLNLMAQGLTNGQIAAKLWISGPTVKTHVSHILSKLGQADRTQAIVHAMSRGIVAAPERAE